MQSLSDLNNASSASVTYIDERPSGITLDHDIFLYYNQLNIISQTIIVNPTVNIVEIIQPDQANVRFQVKIKTERTPALSGSTISWSSLPTGVTQSIVGSTYTLSNITTVDQWELIKSFTWNLPANWANCPLWYLEVSIIYYDSSTSSDKTLTWLEFDTRYYYTAILTIESELVVKAIGTVTLFSSTMNCSISLTAGLQNVQSTVLYSSFNISISADKIPMGTYNLESTFSLSCQSKYGYTNLALDHEGNVRCRAYWDTMFSTICSTNYTVNPSIIINSAFNPQIVIVMPGKLKYFNSNMTSNFSIVSNFRKTSFFNATILSNFSILAQTYGLPNNIRLDTYYWNKPSRIFSSAYFDASYPTTTYKAVITCVSGTFETFESTPNYVQSLTISGTYDQMNTYFQNIRYFPTRNNTSTVVVTYNHYINNVLITTVDINVLKASFGGGDSNTYDSVRFNTAGTFSYTMPMDAWLYGNLMYTIVGAGGAGEYSSYTANTWPVTDKIKQGQGGNSGNIKAVVFGSSPPINFPINFTTKTRSVSINVGAGGVTNVSHGQSSSISFSDSESIVATGGYTPGVSGGNQTVSFNHTQYWNSAPVVTTLTYNSGIQSDYSLTGTGTVSYLGHAELNYGDSYKQGGNGIQSSIYAPYYLNLPEVVAGVGGDSGKISIRGSYNNASYSPINDAYSPTPSTTFGSGGNGGNITLIYDDVTGSPTYQEMTNVSTTTPGNGQPGYIVITAYY